jgi:hypothetical protein
MGLPAYPAKQHKVWFKGLYFKPSREKALGRGQTPVILNI